MIKLLENKLSLFILFIAIMIAIIHIADSFAFIGTGGTLTSGVVGVPPVASSCSVGYDQLTGSDSNPILDSNGDPICMPQ